MSGTKILERRKQVHLELKRWHFSVAKFSKYFRATLLSNRPNFTPDPLSRFRFAFFERYEVRNEANLLFFFAGKVKAIFRPYEPMRACNKNYRVARELWSDHAILPRLASKAELNDAAICLKLNPFFAL